MSTHSAVISYNDGFSSLQRVFSKLSVPHGKYFDFGALKMDETRVKKMNYKTLPAVMKRRKTLRAIRKGFIDNEREDEGGDSYAAGGF